MPRHVPEKKDASNGETRRGAVGERIRSAVSEWETRIPQWGCIPKGRRTRGSETSEYPEEKRTKVIPEVAASETGGSGSRPRAGVVGPQKKNGSAANDMERLKRVITPVGEARKGSSGILSTAGHEEPEPEKPGPSGKPKYEHVTRTADDTVRER